MARIFWRQTIIRLRNQFLLLANGVVAVLSKERIYSQGRSLATRDQIPYKNTQLTCRSGYTRWLTPELLAYFSFQRTGCVRVCVCMYIHVDALGVCYELLNQTFTCLGSRLLHNFGMGKWRWVVQQFWSYDRRSPPKHTCFEFYKVSCCDDTE